MTGAVLTLWALGLAGGLLATLVILKEVALVLRTLGNIRSLAEAIREAAEGLEGELEAVDRLRPLPEAAPALREGAGEVRDGALALAHRLGRLAAGGSRG